MPIKAPIFDEIATRQLRDINQYNKQDGNPNALDEVDAVYQWPYRPEMQFSVYDLKVKRILASNEEDGFVELLEKSRPGIYYGDTIDVFFDLLSANEDALAYFGGGHDFILNIGGNEILFNPDTIEQQLTARGQTLHLTLVKSEAIFFITKGDSYYGKATQDRV